MHVHEFIQRVDAQLAKVDDLIRLARSMDAPEDLIADLQARALGIQRIAEMARELDGAKLPTPRVSEKGVEPIDSPIGLLGIRRKYMLRADWHEPDESDISARVEGDHLDNAMNAQYEQSRAHGELNVIIAHRGADIAVINLATLLSWATPQ